LSITLYDTSKDKIVNNVNQLIHAVKTIEGIENATLSCSSPAIIGTSAGEADWEGRETGHHVNVQWNSIFFNYFETLGVPVVAGRSFTDFNEYDITQNHRATYILNESAVTAMGLTNDEALQVNFTLYDKTGPIVGVVKDFHFKSMHESIQPMAFDILPFYLREFIIRAKDEFSPELVAKVKKVWMKFLPDDPFDYSYVGNVYHEIYRSENRLLRYNGIMAGLILIISSMGLSGLSFLILDQKTKEIGIRKVHGASLRNIMQYLFSIFFKWIFIASAIAIPMGFYISSNWLEKYAYKIQINLLFFVLPVLIIFFIAFISISYRVILSSIQNPIDSLRYE
jgi:putative ABC transport system permease protein